MKRFLILLGLFPMCLISCRTNTENFSDFFMSFHNDASVQIEHIQFPLMRITYSHKYGIKEECIEKSDWTPISIPRNSVVNHRQLGNNAIIVDIKNQVGESYELVFRHCNNKWILTNYVNFCE